MDYEGNWPPDQLHVSSLFCTLNMVFIAHRQQKCCHWFLRKTVISLIYSLTHSYMLYILLLLTSNLSNDKELRKEERNKPMTNITNMFLHLLADIIRKIMQWHRTHKEKWQNFHKFVTIGHEVLFNDLTDVLFYSDA